MSTKSATRWWALLVISLGQLMLVFDVTIVNVALPSIGRAFHVSPADRHWVITAYALAFAGLLLVGGRIADQIGRKRAFLIALVGFAVVSAIGGASVNLGMLVAARAGQGVFAALLAPTTLSLVATTFPDPRERGRAFAVFGVVMGGGSGVGLMLGGLLTEYLSWHWVMYVNAPLALVAAAAAVFVLTESRVQERRRVDVIGAVLGSAGLVALVYGFTVATTHGWSAPLTLTLLAAALVLLLTFVAVEAHRSQPLLPLQIVTHRSRGGANLAFLLAMVAMFGMFLLVTFYLQTVAGFSAVEAGLAFLPFAVGVLVASSAAGRAMTRYRAGTLLACGMLLMAAGIGWLTGLTVDSGYVTHVFPSVVLIGCGLGVLSPVAANLAAFGLPEHQTGVASAVLNVSQQAGGSLGAAALNTIAATGTAAYLAAHPRGADLQAAALVHGYTTATAWAAALLAAGAVAVFFMVNARLGDAAAPRDTSPPTPPGTRTAVKRRTVTGG